MLEFFTPEERKKIEVKCSNRNLDLNHQNGKLAMICIHRRLSMLCVLTWHPRARPVWGRGVVWTKGKHHLLGTSMASDICGKVLGFVLFN